MRRVAALCAMAGLALCAGALGTVRPQPASLAAQPAATPGNGTPIVDPQPELLPVFLPMAVRTYDPSLPGPVGDVLEGYVAALTRAGRIACAPATHVLLTRPEGTRGAETVAVAYAARPGPDLNLDFYLGDFVAVGGSTDLVPGACTITWRSVRVASIVVIDTPPR